MFSGERSAFAFNQLRELVIVFCLLMAFRATPSSGQGITPDADGHAMLNGHAIPGCWNSAAGASLPEDYSRYQEFLPSLHGWDFRINLPHIQFQLARTAIGAGAPAMVGVQEEDESTAASTIQSYGHINNSIWLFQVSAENGHVYGKILPSRRDLNGSGTTNITSLTADWFEVGSAGPSFVVERPAVVSIGKGLNVARIYIVARDQDGALYMTAHTATGAETTTIGPPTSGFVIGGGDLGQVGGPAWDDGWVPLGISSVVAPAISEAFDGKLALAWVDAAAGNLQVKIYSPSNNTWGSSVTIDGAAAQSPQLVWDGTAVNLILVNSHTPILEHTYALADSPLKFYGRGPISSLVAVHADQFHAISFNRRLHVVIRQDDGSDAGPIFYTSSTTDPGRPASWSIPSLTDVHTTTAPRVAWMYENILVFGIGPDGHIRYARKDPNRPGNAQTGGANSDHWLQASWDLDPTVQASFTSFETLTFNSDVYLAGNKYGTAAQPIGLYIVNASRAVLKQLTTLKWGMHLLWGDPGGAQIKNAGEFAASNEIPAVGDVNRDGFTDLIKFVQTANRDGQAPVYLCRNFNGDLGSPQLLEPAFSFEGEIPMVGDFDGDGQADLISFSQTPVFNPARGQFDDAPVRVRLSGGGGPMIWHSAFSLPGEIPFVGDVNGDGRDDIISFGQTYISEPDGGVTAQAPVWVSLSNGTSFGPRTLWHSNFSSPGEIPMVGDFNGDGKVDIVSFAQSPRYNSDGSLLGTAPVYVALSDGTQFGPSTVWHTYFCPAPEIPLVADLDMDGRADIVTCLADKPGAGSAARNIFVAYSLGSHFNRSSVWHSDFVTHDDVRLGPKNRVYSPAFGHLSNATLGTLTGKTVDSKRPIPDLIAFSQDGSVKVARTMGNVPYPPGAPWERYKFFTDKGIGVALYPEWIYEGPGHCIANSHRLALNGSGGVGGGDLTVTSVRFGGRAPHILEELGHSIFANCFRPESDPFSLFSIIFSTPDQGGIGAPMDSPVDALPGCPDPNQFLSCRPEASGEHYFLELLSRYRLNPEFFRQRIAQETDPTKNADLSLQYQWIKDNWFEGLEFATNASINASLEQPGVPLLPAALPPIAQGDSTGTTGGVCGNGAACGAGSPFMLLLTLMTIGYRPRRQRIKLLHNVRDS